MCYNIFVSERSSAEISINQKKDVKMKTIADIMNCPKCGSENTYEYSTDEIEFCYDGTGHYYVDCACADCKHKWRLRMYFKYDVTSDSYFDRRIEK
jgi:hypothetical protein